MKFPLSVLDRSEYFEKVYRILTDEKSVIFIDTNILAYFYKINKPAREEFFKWLEPYIQSKRFKIPNYVMQEYTNHYLNDRVSEYFSSTKKIKTSQKDFVEIKNFLKLNIDDVDLAGTNYESKEQLEDELRSIEEKLNNISIFSKAKKGDYIQSVHERISKLFEDSTLNSDLTVLFKEVQEYGETQYKHRYPPGYRDERKDENLYGDLIIWKEILSYCKENDITKVAVLIQDNKKDWMYAPKKIKTKGHVKSNSEPALKVIDTRLEGEFELVTQSDDIVLINFDTLTQLLIEKGDSLFKLAEALQIVHYSEKGNEKKSEDKSVTESTDQHQEKTTAAKVDVVESEPKKELPKATKEVQEEGLTFDNYALADSQFQFKEDTDLYRIIGGLKTHDWYSQNDAIEYFQEINFNVPGEFTEDKNEFFVLGRNIYQAACGGAYSVIPYLENLDSIILNYNKHIANYLVAGMFYEIYFDSENVFRYNDFKSNFYEEVFQLQINKMLSPCIEFINNALTDYEEYLLVKPSQDAPQLEMIIKYDVGEHPFDEKMTINIINDIECGGKSLIYDNKDSFLFTQIDDDKEITERTIAQVLLIPRNQLSFKYVKKSDKKEKTEYYQLPKSKKLGIPPPEGMSQALW